MIEHVTEQQLNAQQQQMWHTAKNATEMKNYGYVVTLLKPLVKALPGFLEARKLLRASEASLNPAAKKASLFGSMRPSYAKKPPLEVLALAEDDLEKDPFSIPANEELYNAAMALDYTELANFALETIRKGHGDNVKYLHKLAKHYVTIGQDALAVPVYADIIKINPSDSEAIKGEKDAAAKATMTSQKWGENTSMRELQANSKQVGQDEQNSKIGVTKEQLYDRLAQLSANYQADPQNLATVRNIAGVYEQLEEWNEAYNFYHYAFSLSHNDVSLETKASQMRKKAMELYLTQLAAAAEADPDNAELQQQLAQYRQEHAADQINDCLAKVDVNPTDTQLRFELGSAYYSGGQYTEAIPQLQKARSNPHLRIKAMLMLGKCYDAKQMYDIAVKQLSEAAAELAIMDATKKDVLYTLGQIYLKMGNKQQGIDSLKLIYDADYDYRDVAQIVEGSYSN